MLFIGPPHGQTGREIEVLVNVYSDGREAVVFQAEVPALQGGEPEWLT